MSDEVTKSRRDTKSVGSYILGETLGEGAFGKVKVGTHIQTNEKCAIKILDKEKMEDDEDIIRVQREIAILKKLRHKNLIQLYELMETPRKIYLAMEYCEGKELYDYIIMKKKLSEAEACKFFQEIIDGIDYLHSQNIVHRDLKPENLLLDYKLNIKISDFGLSSIYHNDSLLSTPCGTPSYAPPEMLKGEDYHGLLSDVWSCGIILYAMLVGYLPFSESDEDINRDKIITGEFEMPDYISEDACDLLSNILQTDPLCRYTIDEIKAHPWFNCFPLNLSPGLIIGYHIIPVDEKLLDEVVSYGYDRNIARENIKTCKFDTMTSIYYLALRRIIKQGLTSVSDLQSQEYLDYIKDENNIINRVLKEKDEAKPPYMSSENIDEERKEHQDSGDEYNSQKTNTRASRNSQPYDIINRINCRLNGRRSLFIHEDIVKEIEIEISKQRKINIHVNNYNSEKARKSLKSDQKDSLLKPINLNKERKSLIERNLGLELGMKLLNEIDKSIKIEEMNNDALLIKTESYLSVSGASMLENHDEKIKIIDEYIADKVNEDDKLAFDSKININKKKERKNSTRLRKSSAKERKQSVENRKSSVKERKSSIDNKKINNKSRKASIEELKKNKKQRKSSTDENSNTTKSKKNEEIKYDLKYTSPQKNKEEKSQLNNSNTNKNIPNSTDIKKNKAVRIKENKSLIDGDLKYKKNRSVSKNPPKEEKKKDKPKRKNRLLSAERQIKDTIQAETSFERSNSNSSNRNLSYSPDKAVRSQKNRVEVTPWHIKKKLLEEKNNQKIMMEYEEFKKHKIEEREQKKKIIRLKVIEEVESRTPVKSKVKNFSNTTSSNNSMRNRIVTGMNSDFELLTTDTFRHNNNKFIILNDQLIKLLQVYDGTIDFTCMVKASIKELYARVIDVMNYRKILFLQTSPFKFRCSHHGYSFDFEIFKLEIEDFLYFKLRLRQGDITGYRRFIQSVLDQIINDKF